MCRKKEKIKKTLAPQPPPPPLTTQTSGSTFKVALLGSLAENVHDGAYYRFSVKVGAIKIVDTLHNICHDEEYLDVKYPQAKGEDVVWESRDIKMASLPPSKYDLEFDAYTDDDSPLFCVRAQANVQRPTDGVSGPVSSSSGWAEADNVAFRVQA
jgi:hypothetical protein